jgi:uncharacterized protein with von Willebrand factor type A (vWA) domain
MVWGATLCSSLDDNELYDRAFTAWFTDSPEIPRAEGREPTGRVPQAALGAGSNSGSNSGDQLPDERLATRASTAEVLRHRDVATLTDQERTQLATLFDALDVVPPLRRALRRRPHRRGAVDLRRTLRAQLRGGRAQQSPAAGRGAAPADCDVDRRIRLDEALRRLTAAAGAPIVRAAPNQVEVFTMGTRLTRISPALRVRQADEALAAAGLLVPDWSGGTRLGEVIGAFLNRWGRRGLARSAVVVIASDGWERDDARLLGEQMRGLRLIAYAVIWMNPHRGKAGYAPIQTGIQACLPHLDRMVAGHSLAAFAELLEVLADV